MRPREERRCLRASSGTGQRRDPESTPGPAHPPRSPRAARGRSPLSRDRVTQLLPGQPGQGTPTGAWGDLCPPAPPAPGALGAPLPGCGGMWSGRQQLRVLTKNLKTPSYKLKRTIGIKDGSAVRVQALAPACRACGAAAWDPRSPRPTRGAVTGGCGGRGGSAGGPDPQHRQPGAGRWD